MAKVDAYNLPRYVVRTNPDGLDRRVYEFRWDDAHYRAPILKLHSYREQSRMTRRHSWHDVTIAPMPARGMRDHTATYVGIEEVAVPREVVDEALGRIVVDVRLAD